MTEENGKITSRLVCVDRDLLVIPSLAIHMNRSVNESCSWNIQKDLLPLYGEAEDRGAFMKLIARKPVWMIRPAFWGMICSFTAAFPVLSGAPAVNFFLRPVWTISSALLLLSGDSPKERRKSISV